MGKSLTLFTYTNIQHELTEIALNKTIKSVPYDEILVCSDKQLNINDEYNFLELKKANWESYTHFVQKELYKFINTSHVLIVQYDGFASKPHMWNDNFLDYDYIGSPASSKHPVFKNILERTEFDFDYNTQQFITLGGGFNLRSKKLLDTFSDDKFKISHPISDPELNKQTILPEDYNIAVFYRKILEREHEIKFAPLDLSLSFCSELLLGHESLGFHSIPHLPFFLSEKETLFFLEKLKEKLDYKNLTVHHLMYSLCCVNYHEAIKFIMKKTNYLEGMRRYSFNIIDYNTCRSSLDETR